MATTLERTGRESQVGGAGLEPATYGV
jgi:hypothetical protein